MRRKGYTYVWYLPTHGVYIYTGYYYSYDYTGTEADGGYGKMPKLWEYIEMKISSLGS